MEGELGKGVTVLVERNRGDGEEGSVRGTGIGSPGRSAEKVGDRGNDDSVTESVEAKGDTEGVASSKDSGYSRLFISAVARLHTSQNGSGHNIRRKRIIS